MYRHCGTEGRCVSDHHSCECRCQHCAAALKERKRMLNEADKRIHRVHTKEAKEICSYCVRLEEERLEQLATAKAERGPKKVQVVLQ